MVAQLVHVWVVLCHDCDGVTLLTYDKTRLLLGGITQVYPIILRQIKHRKVTKQPQLKSQTLSSYAVNYAFRITANDGSLLLTYT